MILFSLLVAGVVAAQDFNPRFPKILFQRPAGISGGAIDQFFARYDLVIHGGAGPNAYRLNDRIRSLNRRTVIFGTSRQGVWPGSFPPECFMYRPSVASLTRPANPGDQTIYVNSTAGFPAGTDPDRFGLIGGAEWFTYSNKTDTSFTGVAVSGSFFLQQTHAVGDSIKTPIRFVGFGMLQNLTPLAPQVNGQPVWQYFIDKRFDLAKQDFSQFDGIFYDAFRLFFWKDDMAGGVDLDYDRIDDLEEHGLDWINQQWAAGVQQMLPYEHQKLQQLNPNEPPVIAINTGAAEDDYGLNYCEGMMWEGFMRFASTWEEMLRVNRLWEQRHQPVYTLIEDYDPEQRRSYSKNKFAYMRYGLTTALMAGAYYGRTFGDYYYISLYYDEFDTDLGYPTSAPQRLGSGIWVRFFDRGAAICNPTGLTLALTDADLRGLSGYHGPYYRLMAGQDPVTNNGRLFDMATLAGTPASPVKYIKGDGILLFSSPDTVVSDIVVGNCFNNDTSPASDPVVLQGNWQLIKDPSYDTFDDSRNPCYSQWSDDSEDGIGYAILNYPSSSGSATFVPTIGVAGYYEISEWHGWGGGSPNAVNEATNALYEVIVDGQTRVAARVDQTTRAGQWNRLAIVHLPVGKNGEVRLSNAGVDGAVIADAVRFRFRGTQPIDTTPPEPPKNVRIIKP